MTIRAPSSGPPIPPTTRSPSTCIDISYNSIREQVVEFKNLIVKYVPTAGMLADPFTKNLLPGAFKDLFGKIFGLNKPLSPASPAHPSRGGDSQNKRKQKKLGQTIDKLTRSLVKAHIVGIGALGLASTGHQYPTEPGDPGAGVSE